MNGKYDDLDGGVCGLFEALIQKIDEHHEYLRSEF